MHRRVVRFLAGLWHGFWRHWIRIPLLAGLLSIVLLSLTMAFAMHFAARHGMARPADVIVVLGGGVEQDARPTSGTYRRSAHAAFLFKQGYAPVIVCSGGFAADRPISEAESCRRVLHSLGVPETATQLEETSKSTEENAIHTQALMHDRGWQTALVVTDGYHLLRTQLIFELHQVPVSGYSSAQESTGPLPLPKYLWYLRREVIGMFWQGVKTVLGLPLTHVDYF